MESSTTIISDLKKAVIENTEDGLDEIHGIIGDNPDFRAEYDVLWETILNLVLLQLDTKKTEEQEFDIVVGFVSIRFVDIMMSIAKEFVNETT